MTAVLGIDLRGWDCKVAFHLDNIQSSVDLSNRKSNGTSQQSSFSFAIENIFHGVNFNYFNNIPEKDIRPRSEGEYNRDIVFINPSAPLSVESSIGGKISLKLPATSYLHKIEIPVEYFLALLFRRILHTVSALLSFENGTKGIETFQTVVIVPAHFDEVQQEAIFKGATLAGFSRVGLLRQMAAICKGYRTLYRSLKTNSEEYTLFIDVDDSSSTVFLVSKEMRIMGSERDDEMGGRDLDLALASYLGREINTNHNLDVFSVPNARFILLQKCSQARAKIIFSQEAVLELSFPTLNLEYRATITEELLFSISSSFLNAISALIQASLEESDIVDINIRTVVFSGDDLSLYKSRVMEKFPGAICRTLEGVWRAKSALNSNTTIPEALGGTISKFWIGRLSKDSTVSWKPWNTSIEIENDIQAISKQVKEIEITGRATDTPLPQRTSHRDAVQLPDEYERPGVSSFVLETTQDTSEIETDIAKSLADINTLKDDDPGRPNACNNLCALYMKKYASTKEIRVLNSALVWGARALENVDYSSPDAKPEHVSNVAACLHYRYDETKDLHTLNMAILYQSYIVDPVPLDDTDPINAGYLMNYGVLLRARGEHLGDTDDLVKGAKYVQRAIGILSSSTNPSDRPHLVAAVINMGNSLHTLYRYTGTVDDLYHTIQCFEIALSLLEQAKNAEKLVALNGMGLALMLHHQHFGDMESVNKAATCFQEALEYVPDRHPSKALYLSSYANSLAALYHNSKHHKTINQAIEIRKTVVELTKDEDPSKANYIDKLGGLYGERFSVTNDVGDLNEAIKCHEAALLLTNEDQLAQKSFFLNNLGTTLRIRSVHLKTTEDFTRSISTLENALDHTSYGASRANIVFNLADAYMERYKTEREEPLRLKCIELCREVVGSLAPLTVRFRAAGLWTEAALHSTNGPETLGATTTMVDLLSQLAWPGLSLSSQINVLRFANHAASNAAAIALHFKDIRRALEWLEQGRAVSWNQILHMRSPLEDLKAQQPQLAAKIIELSRQLEIGEAKNQASPEAAPLSQNTIALERDKLFKQARAIPGFEKLMIAKEYLDFFVGTYDGPIVVVNVSRYRCDALIFSQGHHPVTLPLETFSLELAEKLKATMLGNLKDSARLQRHTQTDIQDEDVIENEANIRYGRPRKARVTESTIDANFRHILKELWIHVVRPIANFLQFGMELDEDLPHIWWCPTGPLTFLPLHAAGIYAADDDHETPRISLLEYAVSSYIPSLTALHNIMYKRTERPPFSLLSVVQPDTPGQQSLPTTLLELEIIKKCAHQRGLSKDIHVLQGEDATCEAVMNGMKKHSWIHLACHGEQDVHEPTKSGLILHDNRLLLQDIVKSSLPNADFAFLSACQTASGDVGHPDEAVHLAAGMLMAGFRSVIASMWSIGDRDASVVAEDVYSQLFKEGKDPDSRMAARALHRAVRNLRVRHAGHHGGTKFLAWLPFIHFGM